MPKPIQPCRYCGGPKPAGRGRISCDACRDEMKPIFARESTRLKGERAKAERTKLGRNRRDKSQDPEGTSWCSRCQQTLPHADFNSRQGQADSYCRECYSSYAHERRLRLEYGITADDYETLLTQQGGRCAICLSIPRSRRLAVDHDHKTGVVRGLLCTRCNHKILGAARESAPILRRAAAYIIDPPAVSGRGIETLGEWANAVLEDAIDRLAVEQANAGTRHGAVIVKRIGKADPGEALFVMRLVDALPILRELGWD